MATATAGPFVIQSVVAGTISQSSRSIFDDVEAAKLRTVQARRAVKRRLEVVSQTERVSQQSDLFSAPTESSGETRIKSVTQALLCAETELEETRGIRRALEERRNILSDEIAQITAKIESLKSQEEAADLSTKRQDEVEMVSNPDDLSSVVCPFELMGKCTDSSCPHMHLNR